MKLFSYSLLGIVFLALVACDKETSLHTIQGNLKSNCSQPLANAEVALKTADGSLGAEPLILGSAITQSNGNFQFTYELEENESGNAELIRLQESGYTTLISDIDLGTNLQLKLFETNTATSHINLSGSRQFGTTDTLFYSVDQLDQEYSQIQPVNGVIDTLQFEIPNTLSNQTEVIFYYGIGMADFRRAEEASTISDSTYQNISFQARGCFGKDEVNLEIN